MAINNRYGFEVQRQYRAQRHFDLHQHLLSDMVSYIAIQETDTQLIFS